MDLNWISVWAIAASSLAPLGYRWARRHDFGRRRAIRRVPLSLVRDAPEGRVHLRGRVICDQPLLEAPFSRRRCVFHEVLIENRSNTSPVLRKVRGLAFRIEDDTGTARVTFEDVGGAPPFLAAGPRFVDCVIPRQVYEQSGDAQERPGINTMLADHGIEQPGWWLSRNLSGSEGVIQVGDVVDVVGSGTHRIVPTGEASGYRAPPKEYVIEAAEDAPLVVGKV